MVYHITIPKNVTLITHELGCYYKVPGKRTLGSYTLDDVKEYPPINLASSSVSSEVLVLYPNFLFCSYRELFSRAALCFENKLFSYAEKLSDVNLFSFI